MEVVKLTLLLVLVLVTYASARPQRKNSFDISAGLDSRGNAKIGLDYKHNFNRKTSLFVNHRSTFGNANFHETRGGVSHRFNNGGELNGWVRGNSNGHVGAGIGYKISFGKKR